MKRFRKIYLEISNICNLNCAFCPGTKRKKQKMSVEDFRILLSKLQPWTDFLYFHLMGEPLCHPDLYSFLELADEHGFRVILTTNGTNLSKNKEQLVDANGLHKVNISLHAFEANDLAMTFEEYLDGCFEFGKQATKVCDLLTDKDKEYKAVLLLGQETDTQDISGEVLNSRTVSVTEEEVRTVILSFVGAYEQVPPMYSALKVNGQKLCDLARKGITVERKARPVVIHNIEITNINLPEVEMIVSCSKGTYIRTLCDDIGKKLGCFGCMKSLLRTKVDKFTLETAYTLTQLQRMIDQKPEEEWNFVESIDSVFYKYQSVKTSEDAQKLVVNGNRIPASFVVDFSEEKMQEQIRLYDFTNKFIGIYTYIEESKEYKPVKLFMD